MLATPCVQYTTNRTTALQQLPCDELAHVAHEMKLRGGSQTEGESRYSCGSGDCTF